MTTITHIPSAHIGDWSQFHGAYLYVPICSCGWVYPGGMVDPARAAHRAAWHADPQIHADELAAQGSTGWATCGHPAPHVGHLLDAGGAGVPLKSCHGDAATTLADWVDQQKAAL